MPLLHIGELLNFLALSDKDVDDAVSKGLKVLDLSHLAELVPLCFEVLALEEFAELAALAHVLLHELLDVPWFEIDDDKVILIEHLLQVGRGDVLDLEGLVDDLLDASLVLLSYNLGQVEVAVD